MGRPYEGLSSRPPCLAQLVTDAARQQKRFERARPGCAGTGPGMDVEAIRAMLASPKAARSRVLERAAQAAARPYARAADFAEQAG